HHGLPRQGVGSDATTRRLLELAGPLPARPRALDLGCGPGRSALLLAAEAGARVTAVDLHQPFLTELAAAANRRGLTDSIHPVRASMADLPFRDGSFDVIWCEGAVYHIGFDTALRTWKRLLAPGGVLVVTECEWATDNPSGEARAFWAQVPLRDTAHNRAAAREAGYTVEAVFPLPDSDWFDEYYTPLSARLDQADPRDPAMAEAVAASRREIELRRRHGSEYQYTGYVLRREEDDRLRQRLAVPGSDLAASYPPHWLIDNAMGPNPLWLTETLAAAMTLTPGMRVLDLGCGKAITSIFLAREYGVQVWAADLWIDPTPNWERVRAASAADRAGPVKAEAHALPFAEGYFDAIVCVDAYEYFGTDERYLAYLSRFVRPGGQIGVSVPATVTEWDGDVPAHLRDYRDREFHTWHTPQWWRRHWAKTGQVEVERADLLPEAATHWRRWEEAVLAAGGDASEDVVRLLRADAGRTFSFARLIARRTG